MPRNQGLPIKMMIFLAHFPDLLGWVQGLQEVTGVTVKRQIGPNIIRNVWVL